MTDKRSIIKAIIQADYKKQVEKFKKQKDFKKIIFLGDSIVSYFPYKNHDLENKVINHGIPGDTTEGVLNRITETIRLKPTKVIMSIGSNDLVLTNLSINETVKNIIRIKNKIEKDVKNTVYIMSLTPMIKNHDKTNKDYVEGRTNDQIKEINYKLKKELNEEVLINIYDLLLGDDQQLSPDLTTDGIHLNKKGYQIYYDAFKHLID